MDCLAHGTGYNLFLSHGEAVMVLKGGTAVRMKPVGANARRPGQMRSTGNRARVTTSSGMSPSAGTLAFRIMRKSGTAVYIQVLT